MTTTTKKLVWEYTPLQVSLVKHNKAGEKSVIINLYKTEGQTTKRVALPSKFPEDFLMNLTQRHKLFSQITLIEPSLDPQKLEIDFNTFFGEHYDEFEAMEAIIEEPVANTVLPAPEEEKITNFTDVRDIAAQFIIKQPIYFDEHRIWWLWNHKLNCWGMVDETDIMKMLDSCIPRTINTCKSQTKSEILEYLRKAARTNVPQEAPKTWVQFKDVIIDVETKEIVKPSPTYMITNPLPFELGRTTETPIIDSLIKAWVDPPFVQTMYEIIAYCMLPDYPLHRIFCFTGSGSNGKGCYMSILRKFIGARNTTSSELDILVHSRFEKGKLYKKLLCQMGETNWATLRQTSLLKQLTGQDLVSVEFKGKDIFDAINYAKIIISTNSLPMTEDRTKGFYRRWIIIDFPNVFNEKSDILKMIPEKEFANLGLKCVEILNKLLKNREFIGEGTIEQRMARYEEVSNPLCQFIDNYCDKQPFENIPAVDFNKAFVEYLVSKGRRIMKPNEIVAALGIEGYSKKVIGKKREDGTSTTYEGILGIKWNAGWTPKFDVPQEKSAPPKEGSEKWHETEKHKLAVEAISKHLGAPRKEIIDNAVSYSNMDIDEVRKVFDYMSETGQIKQQGEDYVKHKLIQVD